MRFSAHGQIAMNIDDFTTGDSSLGIISAAHFDTAPGKIILTLFIKIRMLAGGRHQCSIIPVCDVSRHQPRLRRVALGIADMNAMPAAGAAGRIAT